MRNICLVAVVSLALVACGGGGDGGQPTEPVSSSLTFPIKASFSAQTASGYTRKLAATGTSATQLADGLCSGTIHATAGPATAGATFEGAPALSVVGVATVTFTNCSPPSSTVTVVAFYDANYQPLGLADQAGSYGLYLVPAVIPTSVTVGSVGVIGTVTYYTNSSKTSLDGRADKSYVIEPDTASSAIVNLITKRYNAFGQLLFTEQDRTRITSAGALTVVSTDIQFATTSTTRLIFR